MVDTNLSYSSPNKLRGLTNAEYLAIHLALEKIKDDLEDIRRKISQIDNAFLRDDLSEVDYPGHRKEHLDRRQADVIVAEYKVSATKMAIGLVVSFIVGLLATGIGARLASLISTGST